MDEKLVSEMVQDLQKAVGYKSIPDHALSFAELLPKSEMTKDALYRALKKVIENGTWRRARRGNVFFYWKALKE